MYTSVSPIAQVELHTAMLFSVLVLGPSTLTMLLVLQVLVSYWSALAEQFQVITVFILLMLVWGVKVYRHTRTYISVCFVCLSVCFVLSVMPQSCATKNIFVLQHRAHLVSCNWEELTFQMRGEWKSA